MRRGRARNKGESVTGAHARLRRAHLRAHNATWFNTQRDRMCAAQAPEEHVATRVIARYNALCTVFLNKYDSVALRETRRDIEMVLYDFSTAALEDDEWRFAEQLARLCHARDRRTSFKFEPANDPASIVFRTPRPDLALNLNIARGLYISIMQMQATPDAQAGRIEDVMRAVRMYYGSKEMFFNNVVMPYRSGAAARDVPEVPALWDLVQAHGDKPVFTHWPTLDTLFAGGTAGPALMRALAANGVSLRLLLNGVMVYGEATGDAARTQQDAQRAVTQLITAISHVWVYYAPDGGARDAGRLIAKALLAAAHNRASPSGLPTQQALLITALADYVQGPLDPAAPAEPVALLDADAAADFAQHLTFMARAEDQWPFDALGGVENAGPMLEPVFGEASKSLHAVYPNTPLRHVCAPSALPLYMYKRLWACVHAKRQTMEAVILHFQESAPDINDKNKFMQMAKKELMNVGIDSDAFVAHIVSNIQLAQKKEHKSMVESAMDWIKAHVPGWGSMMKTITALSSLASTVMKYMAYRYPDNIINDIVEYTKLTGKYAEAAAIAITTLKAIAALFAVVVLANMASSATSLTHRLFRGAKPMPLAFAAIVDELERQLGFDVPFDAAVRRVLAGYAELVDNGAQDTMATVLARLEESCAYVSGLTAGAWFSRRAMAHAALVQAGYERNVALAMPAGANAAQAWQWYEHAERALRLAAARYIAAFMCVSDAAIHPTHVRVALELPRNPKYEQVMQYSQIVRMLRVRARALHVISARILDDKIDAVHEYVHSVYMDLRGDDGNGNPLRNIVPEGVIDRHGDFLRVSVVDVQAELESHFARVQALRKRARLEEDKLKSMETRREMLLSARGEGGFVDTSLKIGRAHV